MIDLEFERVAPSHQVASDLIRELDEELAQRYPVEKIHGLHPDEMVAFPGVFLLARYDGQVVACGAVRPLDRGSGRAQAHVRGAGGAAKRVRAAAARGARGGGP